MKDKVYLMYHKLFKEDVWVTRCPIKWLKENNLMRDEDEQETIDEFVFKLVDII